MIPASLPSWWSGASFCAKAGWLAASGHARNFSEAASMLSKMRKPARPANKPTPAQFQARMAAMKIE